MITPLSRILLSLCAIFLAGCALTGPTFTKPGASAEQVARDKRQCTRMVKSVRYGYESRRYVGELPEVDRACMQRLGYTVK